MRNKDFLLLILIIAVIVVISITFKNSVRDLKNYIISGMPILKDKVDDMIEERVEEELEKREKELENNFNAGVLQGIKIMQQRMLLACESGTPINIEGRAYFIKSDLQNLQHIFSDLEADTE